MLTLLRGKYQPKGHVIACNVLVLTLVGLLLAGCINAQTNIALYKQGEWSGVQAITLSTPNKQDIHTTQLIVALQPIERGSEFVQGSIGRRPWPADRIPPDVIADEAETIGKIAGQNIAPGQVIGRSMLTDKYSFGTSSLPIFDEGISYFGRNNGDLVAIDTQTFYDRYDIVEEELWAFHAGLVTAPPTLVDDVLYVIGGGTLYAVDADTGREIWRVDSVDIVETIQPISPVVADKSVYIKSSNTLYAIDANIGREQWRFGADQKIVSPPTVAEGSVYFTDHEGTFYAVNAEAGEEQWKNSPSFLSFTSLSNISSGIAYFGLKDGSLNAVNVKTSEKLWTFEVGEIGAAPTLGNTNVYVVGSGTLYAVDAATGQETWRFDSGGSVDTTHPTSPIVVDDTVYFTNTNTLYAVNANTGDERWHYEAENQIVSLPAVTDGVAQFIDRDGSFYSIDAQTGEKKWQVKP